MKNRRSIALFGTSIIAAPMLLVSCDKQDKKVVENLFKDIDLADAILEILGLFTISFKFASMFKVSWALNSGQLNLEGKREKGKFEGAAKFPLFKLPPIKSKADLIKILQAEIDRLNRKLRVQDDGSILLLIHNNKGDVAPIPIKGEGVNVCYFSPSASITKISTENQVTTINVSPIDPESYITIGSCSEIKNGPYVGVKISQESEIGQNSTIEILREVSGTWEKIGSFPVGETHTGGNGFRIRVIENNAVLYDGTYNGSALKDGCMYYKIALTLRIEKVLNEDGIVCVY
jgi:hypothetical protein